MNLNHTLELNFPQISTIDVRFWPRRSGPAYSFAGVVVPFSGAHEELGEPIHT